MSRIRLYFDEDALDRGLITALRARRVDVSTALDSGMINRRDEDHLRFATSAGLVLFSFNIADYCALHSRWLETGETMPASFWPDSDVTPWANNCGDS